jgi:hypothetical protein
MGLDSYAVFSQRTGKQIGPRYDHYGNAVRAARRETLGGLGPLFIMEYREPIQVWRSEDEDDEPE